MMKDLFLSAIAMMAAAIPMGMFAQQADVSKASPIDKATQSVKTRMVSPSASALPTMGDLMWRQRIPEKPASGVVKAPWQRVKTEKAQPRKTPLLTAGSGATIWGVMIYDNTWSTEYAPYGSYSFEAKENVEFTTLFTDQYMRANGGFAYYENTLHAMMYGVFYGMTSAVYTEYTYNDEGTWKRTKAKVVKDNTLLANATAYDPNTGMTYGSFYNSDMSAQEFGSIDYTSMKKTTIAPLDTVFLCMATDKQGTVYGITSLGNLCTVDKTSGKVSLVGNTGVEPLMVQQGAVFDPKTGELYWTAYRNDTTSWLMSVDPATAEASIISRLPNDAEVIALYIPETESTEVPAAATNLKAVFTDAELTGTVTFNLPTTTKSGQSLTGEITYTVLANGVEVAQGSGQPGAACSHTITVGEGRNMITVICKNDAGSGQIASVNLWVGMDQPSKVDRLTLTIDEFDNYKATVTWRAPTTGVNGGYLDVEALKYKVVRYPDEVVVAEAQSETSFTENLTYKDKLTAYRYEVTPIQGAQQGTTASTQQMVIGASLKTPYYNYFDYDGDFDDFSIIDGNSDGFTWKQNASYQTAYYRNNDTEAADDWMITPPIYMDSEHMYNISFTGYGLLHTYTEKFSVHLGQGLDPEGDKYVEIVPEQTVKFFDPKRYTTSVSVEESGDYRVAFYVSSAANQGFLYIDSLYVEEGPLAFSPDSATNMSVTPGAKGAMTATVKFTTPTVCVNGKPLEQIDSVEIYLNEKYLVETIKTPAVGATLTFTDEDPEEGYNKYTVVCYNDHGAGVRNSAQAYVGIDRPLQVPSAKLIDHFDGTATLTWETPMEYGLHLGYVDTEALTYNIYTMGSSQLYTFKQGVSGNSLEISNIPTTGDQGFIYFIVSAQNEKGETPLMASSNDIIYGAPYTMPFHESFAQGSFDNAFWYVSEKTGSGGFLNTKEASADADNGSVAFLALTAGESASLNTGKIDIKGVENPKIVFSYYARPGDQSVIEVRTINDYDEPTTVKTIDFSTLTGTAGWRTEAVALKDLNIDHFMRLSFKVTSQHTDRVVMIDNVYVHNVLSDNLSARIASAPGAITAGKEGEVKVRVDNIGENKADLFTVNLLADGKVVDSDAGNTLESNGYKTFTLRFTPTPNSAKNVKLYATVDYDIDLDKSDNTTDTANVVVNPSTLPAPEGLTAEEKDGKIELNWQSPSSGVTKVTDSFEDYAEFTIDNIGRWTVVDGDGASTYGFTGVSFDHSGDPYAFIVFNPYTLKVNIYGQFLPHTGNQYLSCFGADPSEAKEGHNDDWLISPLLSGNEQEISFWARAASTSYPETFEVRYSTTDRDTASFKLLATETTPGDAWHEYKYTLPAGAKYFAVRVISKDQFIFSIDDVTYEVATEDIVGYNIYRDGEPYDNVGAGTTTYTDNDGTGTHTYNVTVEYADGESGFSNDATITAIIERSAATPVVTVADGCICIGNLSGEPVAIYTADGKTIFSARPRAAVSVPVKSGLYLVKVGNSTTRITVK